MIGAAPGALPSTDHSRGAYQGPPDAHALAIFDTQSRFARLPQTSALRYHVALMADTIQSLVQDFVAGLSAVVEGQSLERARQAVESALGGRRPGRPATLSIALGRPRKKAPKQFCPVPGCKNPAAPVFGMVCAKHKDVPKTKIKKFREARRARKLKAQK